jgi:hypothetical protein
MAKRALLTLGLGVTALVGAGGLTGCRVIDQTFSDSRTESAPITEVHIQGDSGDVALERGGSTEAKIDRTVDYHDDKPTGRGDSVKDGVLTINTDCGRGCDVHYTVHLSTSVKVTGRLDSGSVSLSGVTSVTMATSAGSIKVDGAGGAVTATTDSGSIRLSDVKGTTSAQTSSGSVRVSQIDGSVVLQTDSGSIHGDGLRGDGTTAQTQSGSINLALSNPQNVKATSDSGSVKVEVPDGSAYRIRKSSSSGRADVDVTDDPNAKYSIDVSTQSGSLAIKRADG